MHGRGWKHVGVFVYGLEYGALVFYLKSVNVGCKSSLKVCVNGKHGWLATALHGQIVLTVIQTAIMRVVRLERVVRLMRVVRLERVVARLERVIRKILRGFAGTLCALVLPSPWCPWCPWCPWSGSLWFLVSISVTFGIKVDIQHVVTARHTQRTPHSTQSSFVIKHSHFFQQRQMQQRHKHSFFSPNLRAKKNAKQGKRVWDITTAH
jgi:hypothetical protein